MNLGEVKSVSAAYLPQLTAQSHRLPSEWPDRIFSAVLVAILDGTGGGTDAG